MQTDIKQEISIFIVDTFLFGQAERLKDEASFLEEGFIDSTGVLELVMMVEERYGIKVEDEELNPDNFDSVNRLEDYVRRKLGALESAD